MASAVESSFALASLDRLLAGLDEPSPEDPPDFDPYVPGAIQQAWLERMRGGAAPQGGGLMLRPHVGLLYDFGSFRLGLDYSKVKFPNGNIDSDQLGLVIGFPFQTVLARDNTRIQPGQRLTMASVYIAPNLQHYAPTGSAAGMRSMDLAGIEAGRFMSDSAYFFLESAAAARGEADGYAELLGGIGYRYPLGERFAVRARIAAGAAGGGAVDTGGGFIYKATIGAELALTDALHLGLDLGYIDAPDGSFAAETARVTLRYGLRMAATSGYGTPAEPRSLSLGKWALRLSHLTYTTDTTLRKTPDSGDVNLIGLKLDRMLNDRLYLTGLAAAAYEGSAGGYAAGMLGIGYRHRLSDRLASCSEISWRRPTAARAAAPARRGPGTARSRPWPWRAWPPRPGPGHG